jgi:hypothetical protein
VDIQELKPTQGAVGMEQVALKTVKIRSKIMATGKQETLNDYLRRNPQPIVVGPGGKLYIIDRHHLASALLMTFVPRTYGWIVSDQSKLSQESFWKFMEECNWVNPVNEKGERMTSYDQLPATLSDLGDNPFRSLAAFVRNDEKEGGGFSKVDEPFAEFRWAEFFREKLGLSAEEVSANFAKAEKKALKLAEHTDAADLPGYKGNAKVEQATLVNASVQSENCKIPPLPSK